MWASIRIYVPATSLVPVAGLVQELSVKAHAIACNDGSGATIYLIHPHSATDRLRFSQIDGVVFLPHPFSPAPISSEALASFPGLEMRGASSYDFWSALFKANPHPVLDPEA